MTAKLMTLAFALLLPLASQADVQGAFPLYQGRCQAAIETALSSYFKNCESCASIENTLDVQNDVYTVLFYVMRPNEPVLETRADIQLNVIKETVTSEPQSKQSYREILECDVLNIEMD